MSIKPPRTQTQDIAGLDITDRYVSAARIVFKRNGGFQVKNGGWLPLSDEASDQEVVATIKNLWHKCRINTYSVCSCFRSRKTTVKRFAYTDLSPDDLASTVRLEMEATLHRPANDFYFDWHLDPTDPANPGRLQGCSVAAPREDVDHHLQLLKTAGLTPSSLDIPPAALANLYLELHTAPQTDETVGLLNITAHTADLVFITHGGCFHTKTLLSLNERWQNNADYLLQHLQDNLRHAEIKLQLPPVRRMLLTGQQLAAMELKTRLDFASDLDAQYWDPVKMNGVRMSGAGILKESREMGGAMLATSIGTALRRVSHAAV
jgi:Tfp pilus assembly PilM family ATPase